MIGDLFSLSAITEETILFIQQYQYLIAVLTPLLVGELSLHGFGILNGSGDISVWPFIVAVVSVIIFDTLMFCVARRLQKRYGIREKMRNVKVFEKFESVFKKCEARYSKSPALLLFAIKIIPMTKMTIIFFSLWGRMSLRQFLLWDVILSVVYSFFVLYVPGWFVGKELLSQEAGRNITSVLLYLLIVTVLIVLFGDRIEKVMLRQAEKLSKLLKNKRRESEISG